MGGEGCYTVCFKTMRRHDSGQLKEEQIGSMRFTSLDDKAEEPLFPLSVEYKALATRTLLFLVSLSKGGFYVLKDVASAARPYFDDLGSE